MARQIYIATETFTPDGHATIYKDRTIAEAGSDVYQKWPEFFRAISVDYPARVEQATAAPGESRALRGKPAK